MYILFGINKFKNVPSSLSGFKSKVYKLDVDKLVLFFLI